jgi:hypothetical protein
MADVFISYARDDAETARVLGAQLNAIGWSVWQDRNIGAGMAFDQVIEEELNRASCVVVIWSFASVNSTWVRAEASAAERQAKLLPITFSRDVPLPLQFRQYNVIYLPSPDLSVPTDEMFAFLADASRLIGKEPLGVHLDQRSWTTGHRSHAARVVTAGRWELKARFFGLRATYDLRLRPNGTMTGRSQMGVLRGTISGRWMFDASEQLLLLEGSGGPQEGTTYHKIVLRRWESADLAHCKFTGRRATLRRILPGDTPRGRDR